MKEIVLKDNDDTLEVASIGHDKILLSEYDKGDHGSLYLTDSFVLSKEDIKKIYHAIEEEG